MAAIEPSGMDLIDTVRAAVVPVGLNLIGVVSASDYDTEVESSRQLVSLAPGTQTAIVIGHGGGEFWSRFAARPDRDVSVTDPLDAYTRVVVARALADVLPTGSQIIFPFDFPATPVSFQRLARLAGLAVPSLLGVLIHPEFGPWVALRAAALLPCAVALPGPATDFDPCPTCVERACIASCPAGAVTSAGWDIPKIGRAHV